MATLAEFLPHLLPLVPGCPQPLAELTLRGVLLDFCTVAPVVQQVLDPLDVVAGQAQYDIDLLYGVNVSQVLEAYYQNAPVSVIRRDDDQRQPGSAPYALRQAADNSFTLVPTPTTDAPAALVLRVATRPSRLATSVDDLLLNDYGYEIGCGAAARLQLTPGQPFTNPQLAVINQTIYNVARTNARIRAEASYGRSANRVQPRRFI
jgi:hypothetical protein